ncbi:MAG: hypothetical protein EXQ52_07205 [Bryobacterales bacterium]|nr:hypothetical protein [Bryobacterales bacterium]
MPCSVRVLVAFALAGCVWSAAAQEKPDEEFFQVYTDAPRIFLRPQRLRLLRKERERRSMRWQQFETFILGKVPMPEPAFAQALYYQIAGDKAIGQLAVRWAAGPGTDIRQLSLVYDWCHDLFTAAESKAVAAKLQRAIEKPRRGEGIPAVRDRTLAAVAVSGTLPELASKHLESIVRQWWRAEMAPALKAGGAASNPVPRDDVYALHEILHVVRDNLQIDLRDPVPGFFKGLPIFHLLSYYPATFPAPEGEYRIPFSKGGAEPDVLRAAVSRTAELIMVAYDTNAPETQVLQGWLMHDNFLLRSTFGVPYEFLWANPYQPGLSYYHVPLLFHDDLFGRLFIRSSWEENARWLGYFEGEMQLFEDGKATILNPALQSAPLLLTEAVVYTGDHAKKFEVLHQESEDVFIVHLKPNYAYELEMDDEEMREVYTDAGGILALTAPPKVKVGVRLREAHPIAVHYVAPPTPGLVPRRTR